MTLEIDVLALFPSMVSGPLAESIPGRILERGVATVRVHDLREFGLGRHRSVDDTPYGGGAGMVMRVEPVVAAIESVRRPESLVILLDPGGEVFSQTRASDLATREHLVFVCPRYEGVDERIRAFVDLELSIGDYVLTGGELPAVVVIDAVLRLLPGAIDEASTDEESFSGGLLEYPQYTRPPSFRGMEVPADPDVGRPRCRRGVAPGAIDRADTSPPPGPAARGLTSGRASDAWYTPPPVAHHAALPIARPAASAAHQSRNRRVNVLDEIVQDQLRTDLPELATGDTGQGVRQGRRG